MTSKIKRSLVKTFLNTGTVLAPVWVLIGDGIVTGKIAYNPKVTKETYISEDSATTSVDSYAPHMPIECTCKIGDDAFTYLDAKRYGRSIAANAETEIVNVWLYKTPALGFYYAEKQAVAIEFDDFGGEGGSNVKINYTINYLGNPVYGAFNPTPTAAFITNPALAVLATMVIGSVTLTPLFATDKSWLYYAGSVTNATTVVSMTSTCPGANSVVQKDTHGSVVNQGANAALDVGVNHLTITVTYGTEVVIYNIDITRAAA